MHFNNTKCAWLDGNRKHINVQGKIDVTTVDMWQAILIIISIGILTSVAARISNFVLSNLHERKVIFNNYDK